VTLEALGTVLALASRGVLLDRRRDARTSGFRSREVLVEPST